MQRASSSLITKKQEMLKNQTPSLGNQTERDILYEVKYVVSIWARFAAVANLRNFEVRMNDERWARNHKYFCGTRRYVYLKYYYNFNVYNQS